MKVKLSKATITGINIKETIKLAVEIDEIASDDLAELVRTINKGVSLTISDDQTQLPRSEEGT